jgi:acetolactate synthase-1/2/3 large subunit
VQNYRPILIYGAGIHLAHAENEALAFAEQHHIPVVPTWAGLDLLPSAHPLWVGSFGTHGTRAGNFVVQNATHITAIGTRLDSKATGTPIESFARKAHIQMFDIDQREIDKFGERIIGFPYDAKHAFESIKSMAPAPREWLEQINKWKSLYPVVKPEYYKEDGVNPYVFIKTLSEQVPEDTIVCTDTGCAVAWVSQAWNWKKGQRFLHAFNQTPMGYGLPAAIGAYYATGKKVVLVTGDGSLMMSLGELATAKGLPIKIFLLNNQGHAMCRQTQREWLGGTYPSTSIEGGLKFPEFGPLALSGFGIIRNYIYESDHRNERREVKHISMREAIDDALQGDGTRFTEVTISPEHDVVPKVKYGHANEDGHPQIDISKEMLIPLWNGLSG